MKGRDTSEEKLNHSYKRSRSLVSEVIGAVEHETEKVVEEVKVIVDKFEHKPELKTKAVRH